MSGHDSRALINTLIVLRRSPTTTILYKMQNTNRRSQTPMRQTKALIVSLTLFISYRVHIYNLRPAHRASHKITFTRVAQRTITKTRNGNLNIYVISVTQHHCHICPIKTTRARVAATFITLEMTLIVRTSKQRAEKRSFLLTRSHIRGAFRLTVVTLRRRRGNFTPVRIVPNAAASRSHLFHQNNAHPRCPHDIS